MIRNQDILRRFTPRQLRLAFLSQLWNAKVDFSESLMAGEVKTIETAFNVRVAMLCECVCLTVSTEFFCDSESVVVGQRGKI